MNLDDPSLSTGRHRTVMELPGVRISVFPYVKKKKLKEELVCMQFSAQTMKLMYTKIRMKNLNKSILI